MGRAPGQELGSQGQRGPSTTHATRIPREQGCASKPRDPSPGARAPHDCSTHPPSRLLFLMPQHLSSLQLLSVLPKASSRNVHLHVALSFPPIGTQGPLLPFCFSSSRTRLSCTLSLEKGGGELGDLGEEPGGSDGAGKEETLAEAREDAPPPPLAFLLLSSLL